MAKKIFLGKVVSDKMQKTIIVEIERLVKHPVYKKTMRKTGRIKADTAGFTAAMGQYVKIEQTKPISRNKHFKIVKVMEEEKK